MTLPWLRCCYAITLAAVLSLPAYSQTAAADQTPAPARRSVYVVGYVAQGALYIDGGSAEGITPGMTIQITRRDPGAALVDRRPVAIALVTAVATSSAVCEIQSKTLDPLRGDEARLSAADEATRARADLAPIHRRYLQVLEFSGSDPLEEEARAWVSRPPSVEVNRFRGRIAFERTQILNHDAGGGSSSENGAVVRIDWSRIDGTYWNLTGYWRGSLTSAPTASNATLTDLMNRTYQIGLYYNNPKSRWRFGAGRLILPWANSLGTIDGGYVAKKLTRRVTAGMFAGSNPDPTQWNYAPNRQTIGSFLNMETGSYDKIHWSGTAGIALTRVSWRPERQYLFVENNYSVGKKFSIFQTAQADYLDPKIMNGATGARLSQSFVTVRYSPWKRLGFDISDNYFRGIPSFDQRLIGLGMVDQYLFTGVSGGLRVQLTDNVNLTANVGDSHSGTDPSHSINKAFGASWKRLPVFDLRLDLHYNSFNSSFGYGSYEAVGLTRELSENLRLQFQVGAQKTSSVLSSQLYAQFFNPMIDWQFGRHYFLMGNWMSYHGQSQTYDQVSFSLGYRFGK